MKQKILLVLLFLGAATLSFYSFSLLLSDQNAKIGSKGKDFQEYVYPEFEDLTDQELVTLGQKNWRNKAYDLSFRNFQAAASRIKKSGPLQTKALYHLALHYYLGRGVKKNLSQALEILSGPAHSKSKNSLYIAGLILKNKTFKGYDLTAAKSFLLKARELGHKSAAKHLSRLPKN